MTICRRFLVLTVLCTLALATAGCGSDAGESSEPAQFPHTSSQLSEYPAAELTGSLSIEKSADGYCPRLKAEDASNYLLVLPPDAEVNADSVVIGSRRLVTGDVTIGGGEMATDFDDAGCDPSSPAWLVAP